MEAKLIVRFDMIDEDGISIMPKGHQNGFETKIRRPIYRPDSYMINMAFISAINALYSISLEHPLFLQNQDKAATVQDNSPVEESVQQYPLFSLHHKK